jgi:ornithine carbamoyltransferase
MVDGVMARVVRHETLEELAAASGVPIINGLSDRAHPCQALADLLTLRDTFGPDLAGRRVCYVGDANNVMRSLRDACNLFDIDFVACGPTKYLPDDAAKTVVRDPRQAVSGCDAIYTDTWTSMGQEAERRTRLATFAGFAVTAELVDAAADGCVVMHCLPAHRGEEIDADVINGPRSVIFRQAHNRLHAQKGLLATLLA